MTNLAGVFTALVTPFKDGEVDWISLKKLLTLQLEQKIDGLVVCGTTGESPTLTEDENEKIFSFVKSECAGQVPIVVGTGTNSTSDTILATRTAERWGADAALIVVPYYNKPPQRGLFQHFQKIAQSTSLPILLYNVPSRTVTSLSLETIVELSRLDNIVGIKEATGDLEFGTDLLREVKSDFLITSGDDGSFLELTLAGGSGVISVASNLLPGRFVDWCRRARSGDLTVLEDFAFFREVNSYLYIEANPIAIKMALHLRGIIASPELRLPMVQLSEPLTVQLKTKMIAAGLI